MNFNTDPSDTTHSGPPMIFGTAPDRGVRLRAETRGPATSVTGALQLTATVGFCMAVAGCSAGRMADGIPLGEWSGNGSFVYDIWERDAEATTQPTEPSSAYRDYATHLTIRQVSSEGEDFVELDIRSERGAIPGAGERTHLRVALARAKSVSDSASLYRVVDWKFNPDDDESLDLGKTDAPIAASCLRSGGPTVLTIRYHDDFVDIFRFRGDSLEKYGYLYDKNGLIHWWERLSR